MNGWTIEKLASAMEKLRQQINEKLEDHDTKLELLKNMILRAPEGDYKKLADQVNALEDKVYDLKGEVSRQYNTQEEKDRTLRDLITTNQMKIDALEVLYQEQQRQIRDLVLYMSGVFTAMGHDSVTIALKGLVPEIKE